MKKLPDTRLTLMIDAACKWEYRYFGYRVLLLFVDPWLLNGTFDTKVCLITFNTI